jgi:hypothetical protein
VADRLVFNDRIEVVEHEFAPETVSIREADRSANQDYREEAYKGSKRSLC